MNKLVESIIARAQTHGIVRVLGDGSDVSIEVWKQLKREQGPEWVVIDNHDYVKGAGHFDYHVAMLVDHVFRYNPWVQIICIGKEGIKECESVCPEKFDEEGNPIKEDTDE